MDSPYGSETFLVQLLAKAVAAKASDVHLKVGQPPGARVRGDIVYFRSEPLRPQDTEAVARLLVRRVEVREHLDDAPRARHGVRGARASAASA